MTSTDFLNNKKVWRPNFIDPHPIIDVVTNHRQKSYPKEEYSLKVNNIEIQTKSNLFYVENFTKTVQHEKSKLHFIEWSKHKNHTTGRNENFFNISSLNQQIRNEVGLSIKKNPKQIITIKKEKKIARKVYLKWSKYSYSSNDHSQLNIDALHHKNYLMEKYWNLWRKFVATSGAKSVHVTVNKILNRGFSEDNICIPKVIPPKMFKRNSENDILKNRRSVLQLQKQKIEEQANMIKELQLARLKLEEEKSTIERQNILRESEDCDQKLKSKAKFLSSCNYLKTDTVKYKNAWEFVTKMELRAEERKKKWDAIKERKQKLEEEKIEKVRAEEERKKRAEAEEKKQRILQMRKEKQRQEDIRKKQKEERLYLNALNDMASKHHCHQLLKSTFDAFKQFVEIRRFMIKEADKFHEEKLVLYYFTIWKLFYKIQFQRKLEKVENFYNFVLLRRTFDGFKWLHKRYTDNMQVAIDFNDFNIVKNYYFEWKIFIYKQKHEMEKKEDLAIDFHHNKVLKDCLNCWKKLPEIIFKEREKEQRIRSWYNKVQEILPDFESFYVM